jgi:glycosyltransferase involved in cell wall biosynthesis
MVWEVISKMKRPFVSIITPSFNQGIFIEETILSVLSQDYPNIDYIIIDGGSTDNTLEILRKYDSKLKWISEPDRGQADAVNKGLCMAKGEIIGWLNSDDTYNPGAVSKAVEHFSVNPEIIMLYGEAHFIDKGGNIIGKYPTEQFSLSRLADTCFICQPTVFMRAEVLKEIGMLDTNLHTCIDYDYWIRISRYYPIKKITYMREEYLANSRMYNENKTISMRKKVYKEAMRIQKKYFGKYSKMWILGYINEIILGKQPKTGQRLNFPNYF